MVSWIHSGLVTACMSPSNFLVGGCFSELNIRPNELEGKDRIHLVLITNAYYIVCVVPETRAPVLLFYFSELLALPSSFVPELISWVFFRRRFML